MSSFQELIGNGKFYRVPPYQRDYSWREEQWEDLWNDLVEWQAHPDDRHFMGALVVEGKSDREFYIIDGQQRLATLSILSLAVIKTLLVLVERGVEPDENRQRAEQLRNRFIGEKDPASLIESSRLFLNENDDAFYQDYLVQLLSRRAIHAGFPSRIVCCGIVSSILRSRLPAPPTVPPKTVLHLRD